MTCLNEALANVLSHGGPQALTAPIRLSLHVRHESGGHVADLKMTDAGVAFNPLDHVPNSRPQSLDEAEIGGLGIRMMKEFSDELHYRRVDGENHLSFGVRWGA